MTTLSDALRITDSVKRRLALRKLVNPILETIPSADVASVFSASPIVGDGTGQVNIRPTTAALRDALDEATLIALIEGAATPFDVLHAIEHPVAFGIADASKKSGFVFGRPNHVTPELIASIKDKHMTAPTATAPLHADRIADAKIADIVNIAAYGEITYNPPEDGLFDIIEKIFGDKRASSARALFSLITEEEMIEAAGEADPDLIVEFDMMVRSTPVAPASVPHASSSAATVAYTKPKPEVATAIDAVLSMAKLPGIEKLIDELNAATAKIVELETAKSSTIVIATASEIEAKGEIPKGKVVTRKATDVFGITKAKDMFAFDVPVFEWDGRHPHVPALDENYIFRPYELFRALWSLITNKRSWLTGHSGTGKTSLCEQIAARLNWPTIVVNFDSEISRMDLIGREVLINEGGTTVSKFVDGVLPMAMQGPYLLVCDEIDFVRSDVSYVLQRALQGDGMVLTEDGGRTVRPHPMFRISATGNTKGQGDDTGLYPGARQQTEAFRDRFTCWISVDYLDETERMQLIKAKVNGIDTPTANKLNKYATEHMTAFKGAQVIQPLTPRGIISLGEALVHFAALFPKHASKDAVTQAFNTVVLDRASPQDAVVLKGIVDRVFG
jgi:cobaltochelatase CobS